MLQLSKTAQAIAALFTIGACGYAVSRIRIHSFCMGSAAIFLIALFFGHLGVSFPAELQTFGLVLYTAAVGYSSGSGLLPQLRKNGLQYLLLCTCTASVGALICFLIIRIGHIRAPFAVGIMTGAFTTSPGFAAAKEAAGTAAADVAAGYGMVYPIGIACKILLMQAIPRLLHADMAHERELIQLPEASQSKAPARPLLRIDKLGMFPFCVAAVLGVLLGAVTIPLPQGGTFSLGSTGGVLIAALLLGTMQRIGPVSLAVESTLVEPAKEIGLLLFFTGAGTEGGKNLGAAFAEYGAMPLLYGVLFVVLPMLVGCLLFRKVLRLPLLNGLASVAASMTCTPSLAVLMQLAGTDSIAAAYATTYPIALIVVIFVVQMLVKL